MRIFKGDDTGGTLGKRLMINVHSKYDLTGCLVIFNYQGITRKWENVHDGDRLEIFFSHNETMKMSVGTFKGVLFTIDASGKYRTINHAVPIEVTTDLKACYGADELDATVGQAIDWDNVINKPFEGVEVDLSTDDKKLAALGTIIEKLGGTVKTFALFSLSALAGLSGLAYEPETNTNSFTRSGVTYAQRGGLGNSSYVVTNVQMSAGDVGAVPDDSAYAAATNRALTVSGASRPLPPYLHVIDFADSYTNELAILPSFLFGGCSSFRNGNWYGRTYDWKYTHAPSFVVRMSANEDRFASVGVASFGDLLKEDDIALGRFSPLFKALPCMTLDGINSEGVFANINVVATNGNDAAYFTGDYPALACVRYILDHFTNALDAAVWVAANAKIPQAALDAGYSFHWMIGDETSMFVVEDGEWSSAPANAMTNFRLFQQDEPYGSGHERYEAILAGVATNADPKAICKSVWFREAYRRPFTRPTEFAGSEDDSGRIPYTATERLLAWAEANVPQGAPESLERNGRSWQSVHSSVYDIRNRQLSVAVQETDDWYVFAVGDSGRVKSVNGYVGHVTLGPSDVHALPDTYVPPIQPTNTNDVKAIIDDEVGGTNAVKDAVASVGLKRDKTDLTFKEPKNEHWVWSSNDPNCPEGWLEKVNRYGVPKPRYNADFGFWLIEPIGGKSQEAPGIGGASAVSVLFAFDHENPFAATATRASATDTRLVLVDEIACASQLDYVEQCLNYKADEFTEWDGIPVGYALEYFDFEYEHGWAIVRDGNLVSTMKGNQESDKLTWIGGNVEWEGVNDVVATRRRVLRMGDALPTSFTNEERIAIGRLAESPANFYGVAIGNRAKSFNNGTAVGNHTSARGLYSTAVGVFANASNAHSTVIGDYHGSHGPNTFNVSQGVGGWYAGGVPIVAALQMRYVLTNVEEVVTNDMPLLAASPDGNVVTNIYRAYIPDGTGAKVAYDDRVSLARMMTDAATNHTAECECIGTNMCNLIKPHIEPVNSIAELYDPTLTALWVLKMVDGEMKYTVKTNEDTCALFVANSVLKDTAATNTSWKVHVDDGNMKFFTYQ